jgi:membrane-associated protease RseP (regulator of RpoE activity)
MAEGIVPFSDLMAPKYTSSLFGPSFPLVANMLYWLWFINFNLGIFNALPIGPLDGGQLYGALIESRSRPGKTRLKNLSMLISLVMLSAVIMSMFLPYLLF